MWIQPRQDLDKQWLQMCYCITKEDIDIIINEWLDEWRIPTIPREVLGQIAEGRVAQAKTQPPQIPIPKKQRMGQTKSAQADDDSEQPWT
jgi:hypothetical protein